MFTSCRKCWAKPYNGNSIHWSCIFICNKKAGPRKTKLAMEGQPRIKAVFTFSLWNIFAFSLILKIFKRHFFKTAPPQFSIISGKETFIRFCNWQPSSTCLGIHSDICATIFPLTNVPNASSNFFSSYKSGKMQQTTDCRLKANLHLRKRWFKHFPFLFII